jgi:lipopolysaccharide export system protein LptC
MNAAKQAAWLLMALVLLACSGWYFARAPFSIKLDNQTLSTTPDTTITHLTVQQFDANGQLSHYLKTPLMHHIPLNNTHQLTTPHIIITQPNQPAWEIRAQQATALQGGQQITFNNDVIIQQKKDAHTEASTLKTEEITYFPNTQLATTLKDVTFVQSGNRVQSTGMNAYLAENRVQLLSHTRGTYASNQG